MTVPIYAVWEITLACDQACAHCGSRAGRPRPHELATREALRVVDRLAALGVDECTIAGGEAYLREDWDAILRALRDRRIRTSLVTGGRGLTRERARSAKEAGVETASVSIDGFEETHDVLRGWRGSWRAAMAALDALREEGLRHTANTQVNGLNIGELDALCGVLLDRGVRAWQIQITSAFGRAADWTGLILRPYDILHLVPKVAELKERCAAAGCEVMPCNDIGYFGPYESRIRTNGGTPTHWQGCGAGRSVLGIESDGTFKPCLSMQTHEKIASATRDDLWGFCRSCYYADVCRAGCTSTAHALLGRPGNMPYCWHRADALRQRGRRERLAPHDGRFELVEEPIPDQPEPSWEERRDETLRAGPLSRLQAARVRRR